MGHFLGESAKAEFSPFLDLGEATLGLVRTIAGGGGASAFEAWGDNTARKFENVGYDWMDAFTGKNESSHFGEGADGIQDMGKQIKAWTNMAENPNEAWNKVNWTSIGGQITGAHYGSGVGNPNTPPSDLMKISDPATKMVMASTRGRIRQAVNLKGAMMNAKMSSAIVGGQPAGIGGGDQNNSGGGEGPPTSKDIGNQFISN